MLSKRMKYMKPSATVELTAKVAQLRRQGVNIIESNVGEPDFDTPANIAEAGKAAIDAGFTRYTAVPGVFELRQAVCDKLKRDNGLEYSPEEVVVSTGAKQALVNALFALVSPGEEVIIPTPCWVSYIDMVTLAGGTPVLAEMDEREAFVLSVERVAAKLTDRTKVVLINTPNNPTGATYSRESLLALGRLACERDFYIISDEVYEKLIYEGNTHISPASLSQEIKERTVVVNGLSKAFAMTGWRLGYAAADKTIARAMNTIQGHVTSATCSIVQKAAIEALSGPQESVEFMRREFDERRRWIIDRLRAMEGITCAGCTGAFYVMPNVSQLYGRQFEGTVIEDSFGLCHFLLEQAHIAIVPGAAFEAPDHVRISYSNSLENIKEGMERMERALKLLTPAGTKQDREGRPAKTACQAERSGL